MFFSKLAIRKPIILFCLQLVKYSNISFIVFLAEQVRGLDIADKVDPDRTGLSCSKHG